MQTSLIKLSRLFGKNVYAQYIGALLHTILDANMIVKQKSPRTVLEYLENGLITRGFKILFILIKHMIPQLGGIAHDL